MVTDFCQNICFLLDVKYLQTQRVNIQNLPDHFFEKNCFNEWLNALSGIRVIVANAGPASGPFRSIASN